VGLTKTAILTAIAVLLGGALYFVAAEGESSGGAGGTKIGGHIKIGAFDYVSGTSTWQKAGGDSTLSRNDYDGFNFKGVVLLFAQEVSNFLSIEAEPAFSGIFATTGATPRVGTDFRPTKISQNSRIAQFDGFQRALLKFVLPKEVELSFGILKPRFTMDYGAELFWEEELNGSAFSCNTRLGAMQETGIEAYRTFEVNKISLPLYLYVVNGNGELGGATNRTPTVMLHVEPELGFLKFSGSFAYGKWDGGDSNAYSRWSGGASATLGALSLRGEFAGGLWKNQNTLSNASRMDETSSGFNVKASYRWADWGKLMLGYSLSNEGIQVNDTSSSGGVVAVKTETYGTFTPVLQFNPMNSASIFIQSDIGTGKGWQDIATPLKLSYIRMSIGTRLTF
jgi:hypothetical protein